MALTFDDFRDKIVAGLGGLIIAGLIYLISSTVNIRAELAFLSGKLENVPNRAEIAQIAAQQGPNTFYNERLNDRITNIQTTQKESKEAFEKLAQYYHDVQIKGYEDIRLMQIELERLGAQFEMWRALEEKRIKDQGGYDPNNKTYNAEETTPPDLLHKPDTRK